MVTVSSGANELPLNIAGQTVGSVRSQFATALNIPTGAIAEVGGGEVDDYYVLRAGDRLLFAKDSAEKGSI